VNTLAPTGPLPYNLGVKDFLRRIHHRYRYPAIVFRAMVVSDFKLRYQASLLGYVWTMLKPLALFAILFVVFAKFIKFGAGVPYYAVYLLFGVVLWGFFVELTGQGLRSVVDRADLMRKISFPRYVVVLSVSASVMISFLFNLLVLVVFLAAMRVPIRAEALWLVPLFLELVALTVSLTFFLSALYVRFRDMNYIWEVFIQAAFYATPILYPLTLVPERWSRILILNPMAQIVQDARHVLVTDKAQTVSQLWSSGWVRAIPVGITLILVVTSVIFFRRRSRFFAEEA
jgi:ABC-2 type transport system permease protein